MNLLWIGIRLDIPVQYEHCDTLCRASMMASLYHIYSNIMHIPVSIDTPQKLDHCSGLACVIAGILYVRIRVRTFVIDSCHIRFVDPHYVVNNGIRSRRTIIPISIVN